MHNKYCHIHCHPRECAEQCPSAPTVRKSYHWARRPFEVSCKSKDFVSDRLCSVDAKDLKSNVSEGWVEILFFF